MRERALALAVHVSRACRGGGGRGGEGKRGDRCNGGIGALPLETVMHVVALGRRAACDGGGGILRGRGEGRAAVGD